MNIIELSRLYNGSLCNCGRPPGYVITLLTGCQACKAAAIQLLFSSYPPQPYQDLDLFITPFSFRH
jgi:hypothetical protein